MRQFLAIDPPPAWREELAGLQRRMRAAWSGWRWVEPAAIHLTLRFLGEVGPEHDQTLRERWRNVAASHPPIGLRLGRVGTFPARGRPRVVWVGVEAIDGAGPLERLAAALEIAAREGGLAPDARPFLPHLTLARARRDGRTMCGEPARPASGAPFQARSLVLFASHLGPGGARYTQCDLWPLCG